MAEEHLDVFDEAGSRKGKATRKDVHTKGLIHRTVMFFLFDKNGRVFVNQRTEDKDFYPGYWSIVLGGHVSAGQSYDDAVRREAEEEAGVKSEPFFISSYKKRKDKEDREDVSVYGFVLDGEPKLDPGEIRHGRFVDVDKIPRMMKEHKFLPETVGLLRILREWKYRNAKD